MKRKFFWFTLTVSVFVAVVASQLAYAGAEGSLETAADVRAGVWHDGKAVAWDIPLLGIFDSYPRGYRPQQPIAFSHRKHVQQNKIECQYCHSGVHRSRYPTIPSLESCMGCHNVVKKESSEIQKLKDYYEKNTPVQWKMVYHLPEYTQFNHERHIKAGFGCQNCHGQVQLMDVVEKVSSLKMGFCVSCHRENGATTECGQCHY